VFRGVRRVRKRVAETVVRSGGLERDQGGQISRWRGCRSSAFVGANGGASAGGAALYLSGARTGVPRRLTAQAGKQAACLHARTRRCARGGRVGQGAGDPHRITVATPILPFLSFCETRTKLELKPKYHQNESCAKFYKLQIIFKHPKLILNGEGRI